MMDERELQYRMRFYQQDMLRERDHDRLRRIAMKDHRPLFTLRFKLPRWRRSQKKERQYQPVPTCYPAESGVS